MNRRHALVISLFLALAVTLGMFSVVRTTRLGATASTSVSQAQINARTRQLDRLAASLRRQAAQRPPALASAAAAPPVTARTVYVRPAPIVKVLHRHGEHESESESQTGGGFDD